MTKRKKENVNREIEGRTERKNGTKKITKQNKPNI